RDEAAQPLIGGERSVLDRFVDARKVLHDDAAGAEIHVTDFGIPHLPLGQTDEALARLEMRMRIAFEKAVPIGRLGETNAVGVGIGAIAPPVENAQNDRAGAMWLRHAGLIIEPGRRRKGAAPAPT